MDEYNFEDRDFFPEWEEDYTDQMERWEDDCGYDPDFPGICHHVGSAYCAFWCPFSDIYFNTEGKS